jgi:Domain of unknown function (DUF4328)
MVAGEQRQYHDARRLSQWLSWLLMATILVYSLSWLNAMLHLHVFGTIRDGNVPSSTMISIATKAIALQGAFGTVSALVLISTMALWLVWVHRMSSNIHALGSHGVRFTPGWAVGWHFVPIANLWMPYQAVSEIWRASKNPLGWRSERTTPLLRWWWFGWLIYLTVGSVRVRVPAVEEAFDRLLMVKGSGAVFGILGALSALFALLVVRQISAFQTQAAHRSLSAVFA